MRSNVFCHCRYNAAWCCQHPCCLVLFAFLEPGCAFRSSVCLLLSSCHWGSITLSAPRFSYLISPPTPTVVIGCALWFLDTVAHPLGCCIDIPSALCWVTLFTSAMLLREVVPSFVLLLWCLNNLCSPLFCARNSAQSSKNRANTLQTKQAWYFGKNQTFW